MSIKIIATGVIAAVSLSVVATVPADAATSKVTIQKIATKKVAFKKSATVSPRVKTQGQVVVSSKTLTVKKGSKTVAKKKKSVKLKAGSYSVSTTVKYRTYTNKTQNKVVLAAGQSIPASYYDEPGPAVTSCVVTSATDVDYVARCSLTRATTTPVTVDGSAISGVYYAPSTGDEIYPDSIVAPQDIRANVSVRAYGKTRTITKSQKLKVKQGAKPRGCATKSGFNKVKNGQTKAKVASLLGSNGKQYFYSSPIEGREYKTCDSYQYMAVSFQDGYVYDKTFADFG